MAKPILCLDFDGVIHSYTSGWKGATEIVDPIVPGTIAFLFSAIAEGFTIAIYSSRSGQEGGIQAMQDYIFKHCDLEEEEYLSANIVWPTEKPPAMITLDDRAITFTGKWPDPRDLMEFKPWNKD